MELWERNDLDPVTNHIMRRKWGWINKANYKLHETVADLESSKKTQLQK